MHDELCPSQVGESAYCLFCIWVAKARNDEREKAAQRVIYAVGAHPTHMTEHDKALVAAARGGEQE